MKITLARSILIAGILALAFSLHAQPTAHYVPGIEGIKGPSLPPPGWYARDYNLAYYADTVNNASGHKATPPNFQAFTYANVPRAIWISDTKFLGGYVGADLVVPLIYESVKAGGYDSRTFGLGDIFTEATLSWHLKQFDLAIGSGVWMPTGDFAPGSTRVGLGYWTAMQTAGATWYVDTDKTWALSALCRYEFNTEQRDTHVTPGQAFTLEWGASKTLEKIFDVGAGGLLPAESHRRQRPGAIRGVPRPRGRPRPGSERGLSQAMFFVSLRYAYEFMAESRAEGNTVSLTLTKRF